MSTFSIKSLSQKTVLTRPLENGASVDHTLSNGVHLSRRGHRVGTNFSSRIERLLSRRIISELFVRYRIHHRRHPRTTKSNLVLPVSSRRSSPPVGSNESTVPGEFPRRQCPQPIIQSIVFLQLLAEILSNLSVRQFLQTVGSVDGSRTRNFQFLRLTLYH